MHWTLMVNLTILISDISTVCGEEYKRGKENMDKNDILFSRKSIQINEVEP